MRDLIQGALEEETDEALLDSIECENIKMMILF